MLLGWFTLSAGRQRVLVGCKAVSKCWTSKADGLGCVIMT